MDPWDALTYLLIHAGAEVSFTSRPDDDGPTMKVESDDERTIEAYRALALRLGGEAL